MALLTIEHLSKSFPRRGKEPIRAVQDVTLEVPAGELLAVLGPSGCGKTTLLRLLAGLESPDAGRISLNGADITRAAPKDRNLAMVFQAPALYPEMTAAENIGLGLRLRNVPREEISRRVNDMARVLSIPDCLERLPAELSGGQCQRVSLGRALVREPALLLLDEPLTSLDTPVRSALRRELLGINRQKGTTMVYVTHDQADAMALGSRLVILRGGAVQQAGAPREVFENPVNTFVAGFLGTPRMNFFTGRFTTLEGKPAFEFEGGAGPGITLPLTGNRLPAGRADQVILGLRPQHLQVGPKASAPGPHEVFDGCVTQTEYNGMDSYAECEWAGGTLVGRLTAGFLPAPGDRVAVQPELSQARFFDAATQGALA